jgi:hypothetical protein
VFLKLIVLAFAGLMVFKLFSRKRKQRIGKAVDQVANLFLVAIAIYVVGYGIVQFF